LALFVKYCVGKIALPSIFGDYVKYCVMSNNKQLQLPRCLWN